MNCEYSIMPEEFFINFIFICIIMQTNNDGLS